MTFLLFAVCIIIILLPTLFALALAIRISVYRRFVSYDPKADYLYEFQSPHIARVSVTLDADGFAWKSPPTESQSAFLEISISATRPGLIFDPYLEFRFGDIIVHQYFERGAQGIRCINLTRILQSIPDDGKTIAMRGHCLTWKTAEASLLFCETPSRAGKKVLVLAPHPDDAELAAFGLYSSMDSVIVTITAGDAGCSHYSSMLPEKSDRASLRVWDSIAIPMMGGVDPSRAINLGYYDGTLAKMCANPEQSITSPNGAGTIASFRKQNVSRMIVVDVSATWNSLVGDLTRILTEFQPDIIATPHPQLDSHADHRYTTLALCEALQKAPPRDGLLYFYTNHVAPSEIYPLGPADSAMSLPPHFGERCSLEGILSLELSQQQQRQKFFAIEAMHDLRSPPRLKFHGPKALARLIIGETKRMIAGLGVDPTSYFRRAVRPNELFFVTPFASAQRMAEQIRRQPAAAL